MSWAVVIFNSSEKITSPEDLDESKLIPARFCFILESHFVDIIQDEDHREIRGKDYSIGYLYEDEPISNMLLNLYGESALFQLISLAAKYNWQIFDTGLGEMIDLSNLSKTVIITSKPI